VGSVILRHGRDFRQIMYKISTTWLSSIRCWLRLRLVYNLTRLVIFVAFCPCMKLYEQSGRELIATFADLHLRCSQIMTLEATSN